MHLSKTNWGQLHHHHHFNVHFLTRLIKKIELRIIETMLISQKALQPDPFSLMKGELAVEWPRIRMTSCVSSPTLAASAKLSANPARVDPTRMFNTSFIFVADPTSPEKIIKHICDLAHEMGPQGEC